MTRPGQGPLALWSRVFALCLGVHLALPDYDAEGWGTPRWGLAICAALLLWRPHGVWLLGVCAIKVYTLLCLRDVLTQSLLLALWSGFAGIAALRGTRSAALTSLDAVRVTAALTYGLAAVHKLNDAFFDPATSCADHALRQVVALWPSLPVPLASPGLAALVVLWEALLALLVLTRSRWLWPVGLAFHLPLTLTLAPAFGAVMVAGWAAGMLPREVIAWRRVARSRAGRARALFGAIVAFGLEALARGASDPWGQVKVGVVGAVLSVWLSVHGAARVPSERLWRRAHARAGAWLLGALFVGHGLSPYLGVRVQHAAAMLSNLRIDPECHNSWLFPRPDGPGPYIYIERAHFGGPERGEEGLRPERARVLRETLWSPTALHTMRANWCVPELRPIALRGHWRGASFDMPDLCAADALSALADGFPSPTWLPGHQAFQKNLPRACGAACVH